ncbi:MAG: cyclic-di-AMP receptor [Anaerolineales bacterium]
MSNSKQTKRINRLMIVVVQEQDFEKANRSISDLGLSVTRLASAGGFLGRRNVTLLIGFTAGEEAIIVEALNENCRSRVEYIATPLEGTALHLPTPMPVPVGGATIFTFEIDDYREL